MPSVPKPEPRQPAKRKPVKRKNVKRSAKEFARCFGSAERVAFVQALPSCVSGLGPCENCHIEGDGAGRRAHYSKIVPLTHIEHLRIHSMGRRTFEEFYAANLTELAEETERAWQAFSASPSQPTLRKFSV